MDYDIDHDEHKETRGFDLGLWRKLMKYTWVYKKKLLFLGLSAAGIALCDLSYPLLTKFVIDGVVEQGAEFHFTPYLLAYGVVTLFQGIGVWAFICLAGGIRTSVSHDIREAGFANLQRLSFSYYDRRPVGWMMARMTSDCDRLSNIMAWGFLDLIWGFTLMFGVAVAMLIMNFKLALIALSVMPVLMWVSLVFQKKILKSSRLVRRTNSRLTASYNEGIAAVRTTKIFGREHQDADEFGGLAGEMFEASVRNQLQSALYLPLVLTLGSLATGLALAVGGVDVLGGVISLGTLIAFMTYTRTLFEPVQEIAHLFAELQMAQASGERVLSLIEAVPDIQDSPAVVEKVAATAVGPRADGVAEDGLPDRLGTIEFEDVGFAYGEEGSEVLSDFRLRVTPGETVALVGSTGGGKSTIVSLLCRFYEPTRGRILIDGTDYRERSLHWLQSQLGIVLQTPHLFSGTLAANLRYGRLDATDAEIEEAARLVGAHDFIEAMDKGYETHVGEGGVRLSTGQKQLISFARALLAQPRILVMDEATSSVDTETEQSIQQGLSQVLEGRTSFVIAHRLSTIRSADRILVIEQGRIAEQGNHSTLMAKRGRYAKLYTQQSIRDTRGEGWLQGGDDVGFAPAQ